MRYVLREFLLWKADEDIMLKARKTENIDTFLRTVPWMLQDLRRFVMYDFSALRPYLISAMSNWARAERLGYARLDTAGKVSEAPTLLSQRTDIHYGLTSSGWPSRFFVSLFCTQAKLTCDGS